MLDDIEMRWPKKYYLCISITCDSVSVFKYAL